MRESGERHQIRGVTFARKRIYLLKRVKIADHHIDCIDIVFFELFHMVGKTASMGQTRMSSREQSARPVSPTPSLNSRSIGQQSPVNARMEAFNATT